jgi:DnaA family protein
VQRAGAIVEGFEQQDLVALDDVDRLLWRWRLGSGAFTLYNGMPNTAGGSRWRVRARLRRFRSGCRTSHQGSPPREVHRLRATRGIRAARGAQAPRQRATRLDLPDETLGFLTRRAPRDFATLCRMLDALDTESLAAQRRLTVHFVRDWLARGEP